MSGNFIDRGLDILDKALVPIAIAVLAYFGNRAANAIAEGQLALAKETAVAQQRANEQAVLARNDEFRKTMQAKYVEMFHADLASGNKDRQATAVQLLFLMEPTLADSISKAISKNPDAPEALREQVRAASQVIEKASSLANFKIGIYYVASDAAASAMARRIEQSLLARKLGKSVQLYDKTEAFMRSVWPPTSLEVRYEEATEGLTANELVAALSEAPLSLSAVKFPVATVTRNFISVFVPSGDKGAGE